MQLTPGGDVLAPRGGGGGAAHIRYYLLPPMNLAISK